MSFAYFWITHQMIEIAISEAGQQQDDETAYLLKVPENKKRLLAAINNVEKQQFIDVGIDALQDEFLRRKVGTI
ncbi:MAG: hypothetical protein IBX56_16830, partial [Methylomicrobium sp.]|nr:hypothetical protein [Methylomicrobium sp.]